MIEIRLPRTIPLGEQPPATCPMCGAAGALADDRRTWAYQCQRPSGSGLMRPQYEFTVDGWRIERFHERCPNPNLQAILRALREMFEEADQSDAVAILGDLVAERAL